MAKKKSKRGSETIRLDLVESVLYRETSCVAHEDVPVLMAVLYEECGLPVPAGIAEEIRENARARGDE